MKPFQTAVINLADFVFIQITKVVAETPTCKFEIKKSPLKKGANEKIADFT